MTPDTCVLPHRRDADRPRRAADGLLVCEGDVHRLEQNLAEMPAHFEGLARRLAPGKGRGQHVSGTPERALPVDPAVVEHRDNLARTLASWARMVADERGISGPRSPLVGSTSAFLLVHLRWACAQPWVDDYAGELGALRSRSVSLLYPSGRKRITVGACIEPDCPGTLTASVAAQDDLLPSVVSCDTDAEHAWEPNQWHTLGKRLWGTQMYDARAAAAFLDLVNGAA